MRSLLCLVPTIILLFVLWSRPFLPTVHDLLQRPTWIYPPSPSPSIISPPTLLPSSVDFLLLSMVARRTLIPSLSFIPSFGAPLQRSLPVFSIISAVTPFIFWKSTQLLFSWPFFIASLLISYIIINCFAIATFVLSPLYLYLSQPGRVPVWKLPYGLPSSWLVFDTFMVDANFVFLFISDIFGCFTLRAINRSVLHASLLTARYGKGPKPGGENSLSIEMPGRSQRRSPTGSPKRAISRQKKIPLWRLNRSPVIFPSTHPISIVPSKPITSLLSTLTILHSTSFGTSIELTVLACVFLPILARLLQALHRPSIHTRFLINLWSQPIFLLLPTAHGSQLRLLLFIFILVTLEKLWMRLRFDSIRLICHLWGFQSVEPSNIPSPNKTRVPSNTSAPTESVDFYRYAPSPDSAPITLETSAPFDLVSTQEQKELPLALHSHLSIAAGSFDPGFVAHLLSGFSKTSDIFEIILDTGCSYAITPHRDDFVQYQSLDHEQRGNSVMTVNGPTRVAGVGIVRWVFMQEDGDEVELLVKCHHVPDSTVRLLSPQDYCAYHGFDRRDDQFGGNSSYFWMNTSNYSGRFSCPIEPRSRLPVALAKRACSAGRCSSNNRAGSDKIWESIQSPPNHGCKSCDTDKPCTTCHASNQCPSCEGMISLSVADETNQNLNPRQKELLLWHWRLGHIGFDHLQRLFQREPDDEKPGRCLSTKNPKVYTCAPPMCAACQIAKAKRRSIGVTHSKVRPGKSQLLKAPHLRPGQCISVDQYESAKRGRLSHTRGRERHGHQYCGGTIFADHASNYVSCLHQVSLRAFDTVVSKRKFERMAKEYGVKIEKYHGDNGVFKAAEFRADIDAMHQGLDFSGVGAHHQNGVAERAIRTVTEHARAMMQNSFLHWPEEFKVELWPLALDYSCWLHNHTPARDSGFAPIEVFASTKVACSNLQRARVWGCPGYVLSPKLQDGKKVPKWAPKARRGQFLGFSPCHSSTIALMRNLQTQHISPQFHVVHDELYSTCHAIDEDDIKWIELFTTQRDFYGPYDDEEDDTVHFPPLDNAWLPDAEAPLPPPQPPPPAAPQPAPIAVPQPAPTEADDATIVAANPPAPAPTDDIAETSSDDDENDDDIEGLPDVPPHPSGRARRRTTPIDFYQPSFFISGPPDAPVRLTPTPTSRSLLGYLTPLCHDDLFIHSLDWDLPFRGRYTALNAMNGLHVDPEDNDVEWSHPFSLGAKASSDDEPTLRAIQRMSAIEQDEWYESMETELAALRRKKTFTEIDRSSVPAGKQIVKSTWAFRRKRRPNGMIYKLKSRFVVRGDLQRLAEAEETFSPVVDWSTVRLLFVLTAARGLKTQTIDFNAAFVQADLPTPLYLELPPAYSVKGEDKVYKVTKSLYGDVRASKLWYKHLSSCLVDKMKMKKSDIDSCLYYRDDLIFVHYVDDGIIASNEDSNIKDFIKELKGHGFDLGEEEDYAGYLGVDIKPQPDGSIHLLQTGLIERILADLDLTDSTTTKNVPAVDILGPHKDSAPLRGPYNYRSVLGKMMYLSTNTRPDIAFANHQCARFSIDPREPHGVALKHIAKYLLKTRDKGMIIKPTQDLTLDCWADADFAGCWKRSDPDDPKSVKSRTGFVVTLGGIPVSWHSKLQSETALSTMEAEYISLSQAMRVLLPMRLLLEEIAGPLQLQRDPKSVIKSTIWEDNQACLTLATTDPPRMTPRSKSIAVKYHWFRERLIPGVIEIKAVGTENQAADIFTKATSQAIFERLRRVLLGW